jgi:hypothetical protein
MYVVEWWSRLHDNSTLIPRFIKMSSQMFCLFSMIFLVYLEPSATQSALPCTGRSTKAACEQDLGLTDAGVSCRCGWREAVCDASTCQSCLFAGCQWCGQDSGVGYCAKATGTCNESFQSRTACTPSTTTVPRPFFPTPPPTPSPTPSRTPLPTLQPMPGPSPRPTPVPQPTMRGPCNTTLTQADCASTACTFKAAFDVDSPGRCMWNRTTNTCTAPCAPPCHEIQSCSLNAASGPQGYCSDGKPCKISFIDPFGPCLLCDSRKREVEQTPAGCVCIPETIGASNVGDSKTRTDAVSNGAPLADSDLALPVGLGVAGAVLLVCVILVIALIVIKRKSEIETQRRHNASRPSAMAGTTPSKDARTAGAAAAAAPVAKMGAETIASAADTVYGVFDDDATHASYEMSNVHQF